MIPTAAIPQKDSTLNYLNYYKNFALGVYNSTTISTIFWKATMNALKYYGVPLAAKAFIILTAIAVTSTPPGWIIAASAVGSLILTHLEIRIFVWATKNCDKTSWLGWLHIMHANHLKHMDHEFGILLSLGTRILTCLSGCKNHHLVHQSERLGTIFQGSLPNRVSNDSYDLQKSNIKAVLSFQQEWELQPCFLSVPYKEEEWESLGIKHKNITPQDDGTLSEAQVAEALLFMANCAHDKANLFIHGNSASSKMILAKHLNTQDIPTPPIALSKAKPLAQKENVHFHSDGSFDYLNSKGELLTESSNWMNGDKEVRKKALAIIFKDKPNADKLVRDYTSKLGQPVAGGKIGREIKLLNITLVSQSHCSWKAK